jgi:hypothetical protein
MNRAHSAVLAGVLLLVVGASGANAEGTFVRLRGQAGELRGAVSAQNGGVLVKVDGQADRLISWHLVRETDVAGCEGSMARGLELMRGVSRVDRGDVPMAGEALEPLIEKMALEGTLVGPTGLATAEAVLRVRLARGSQTGATLAWLAWFDAASERPVIVEDALNKGLIWIGDRSAGGLSAGDASVDGGTGLCPHLPPIFGPVIATPALTGMLGSSEFARLGSVPAGSPVRDVVRAYQAAVAFEVSGAEFKPDGEPSGDVAQMVVEIVLARAGDDAARQGARGRLRQRLERLTKAELNREVQAEEPEMLDTLWMRAWLHLGIGRSLLREVDPAQKREGIVEILTVPALFAEEVPGLAAGALVEARGELVKLGEPVELVNKELQAKYPDAAGVQMP